MAWTLADLTAIETAIASGAKRVKYADKEVEYNSLADMLRLRATMRQELGLIPKTQRLFGKFSKGFNNNEETC